MKDLLEEVIAGEFSWSQLEVDEEVSFQKVQTFSSYILKGPDLKRLKEYERNYGLQGTFLQRLDESREEREGESKSGAESKETQPDKEASVYTIPSSLIDIITKELVSTYEMNVEEKHFMRGKLTFEQVRNYKGNPGLRKTAYKDISPNVQKMISDIYDVVQKEMEVRLRVYNLQMEIDWSLFRRYVEEVTEQVIFQYADIMPDAPHFFIWGKDLKCAVCGKDIVDPIHVDKFNTSLTNSLDSLQGVLEVYDMY